MLTSRNTWLRFTRRRVLARIARCSQTYRKHDTSSDNAPARYLLHEATGGLFARRLRSWSRNSVARRGHAGIGREESGVAACITRPSAVLCASNLDNLFEWDPLSESTTGKGDGFPYKDQTRRPSRFIPRPLVTHRATIGFAPYETTTIRVTTTTTTTTTRRSCVL